MRSSVHVIEKRQGGQQRVVCKMKEKSRREMSDNRCGGRQVTNHVHSIRKMVNRDASIIAPTHFLGPPAPPPYFSLTSSFPRSVNASSSKCMNAVASMTPVPKCLPMKGMREGDRPRPRLRVGRRVVRKRGRRRRMVGKGNRRVDREREGSDTAVVEMSVV